MSGVNGIEISPEEQKRSNRNFAIGMALVTACMIVLGYYAFPHAAPEQQIRDKEIRRVVDEAALVATLTNNATARTCAAALASAAHGEPTKKGVMQEYAGDVGVAGVGLAPLIPSDVSRLPFLKPLSETLDGRAAAMTHEKWIIWGGILNQLSDVLAGLIVQHEYTHVLQGVNGVDVSKAQLALYEASSYDYELTLVGELGGVEWSRLVDSIAAEYAPYMRVSDRMITFSKGLKEFPVGAYDKELAKVFKGPSRSQFEVGVRSFLLRMAVKKKVIRQGTSSDEAALRLFAGVIEQNRMEVFSH